jgi:pyocin large subunit-like protein
LAVALGLMACGPAQETKPAKPSATASTAMAPAAPTRAPRNSRGFRSRQRLDEHFEKHGREFGRLSEDEYLRMAQALRDTTAGGNILEIARRDGVVSRFDRSTGAFIAFDDDGTIRTFFRPNDGERYFQRQARRSPHQ